MYKMVRGSVDELEQKLNEAEAEGFSEIVREFFESGTFGLPTLAGSPVDIDEASRGLVPPIPIPVPQYAFLLRKPRQPMDDVEPVMGALRSMFAQFGFQLPALGKLVKLDGGKVDGKEEAPPAAP